MWAAKHYLKCSIWYSSEKSSNRTWSLHHKSCQNLRASALIHVKSTKEGGASWGRGHWHDALMSKTVIIPCLIWLGIWLEYLWCEDPLRLVYSIQKTLVQIYSIQINLNYLIYSTLRHSIMLCQKLNKIEIKNR